MNPALIGVALVILLWASHTADGEEKERREAAGYGEPQSWSWRSKVGAMAVAVLVLPLGVAFWSRRSSSWTAPPGGGPGGQAFDPWRWWAHLTGLRPLLTPRPGRGVAHRRGREERLGDLLDALAARPELLDLPSMPT